MAGPRAIPRLRIVLEYPSPSPRRDAGISSEVIVSVAGGNPLHAMPCTIRTPIKAGMAFEGLTGSILYAKAHSTAKDKLDAVKTVKTGLASEAAVFKGSCQTLHDQITQERDKVLVAETDRTPPYPPPYPPLCPPPCPPVGPAQIDTGFG